MVMLMKNVASPRPYWHVDAKWLCSLILLPALGMTLLLHLLSGLTQREIAINLSANLIAGAFTRGEENTNPQQATEEVRQQIRRSPDGKFHPFPTFPAAFITEQDLNSKSLAQIKIDLFKKISTPLYDKGAAGTAQSLGATKEQVEKFKRDTFLLSIFTKATHNSLVGLRNVAALISLLALAGLIYFSAGWGRLANPAAIMLATSLPGSFFAMVLTSPPKDGGGGLGAIEAIRTPQLIQIWQQTFWPVTLLACGLLLTAGFGKLLAHNRG